MHRNYSMILSDVIIIYRLDSNFMYSFEEGWVYHLIIYLLISYRLAVLVLRALIKITSVGVACRFRGFVSLLAYRKGNISFLLLL